MGSKHQFLASQFQFVAADTLESNFRYQLLNVMRCSVQSSEGSVWRTLCPSNWYLLMSLTLTGLPLAAAMGGHQLVIAQEDVTALFVANGMVDPQHPDANSY